jgi:hypothetical protein
MRFWFLWLVWGVGMLTQIVESHFNFAWWESVVLGLAFGAVFITLEKWEALWVSLLFKEFVKVWTKEVKHE